MRISSYFQPIRVLYKGTSFIQTFPLKGGCEFPLEPNFKTKLNVSMRKYTPILGNRNKTYDGSEMDIQGKTLLDNALDQISNQPDILK